VHIFTVAAQYALSQEEIDLVLSDEELDSYLFRFREEQKAITVFSLSENACSVFQKVFPQQGSVPSKRIRAMLGLGEGQTVLDRCYCVCYYYISVSNCPLYRWQGPDDENRYEWFIPGGA
jgi:hypothetical protein